MSIRLISTAAFTIALVVASLAGATDYYVAPNGLDTNDGSIGNPFATFSKAIGLATAGDTIYGRGGTYNLSSTLSISSSKSGTGGNPISLLAFPGETPILDFSGQTFSNSNGGQRGLSLSGSYWHIKGFTVQYAADSGVIVSGSNNLLEQMVSRQNQDSGFQINGGGSFPSNNVFLNCDSYGNFDYGTGLPTGDNRAGEDADGFAIKERGLGPGNMIVGARAWNNSDDGLDFWEAGSGVTVMNSWSFNNGIASVFNISGGYAGDGNGVKLGHDSGTHLLQNMLVFGNPVMGVDVNGNATDLEGGPAVPHGVQVYNVTAAFNGSRNFNFDEDPTTASPPTNHFLRNNISYSGRTDIRSGNKTSNNTFNGPDSIGLGVTAADFMSTVSPVITNGSYHPAGTGGDRSGVTTPVHATGPAVAPRQADGSLPFIDFLRLASGSHLIDAGIDVGLPYNGLAPDLGAFETAPIVYAAADFDEDTDVDDIDLAAWETNFGLESLATKSQGDADEDGDVDGGDFLLWQQLYTGTIVPITAVPEPTSIVLTFAVFGGITGWRRSRR